MRRLIALLFLTATLSLAQPAAVRQFLVRMNVVRKDLTLQNLTDEEKATLTKHGTYLKKLQDEGKLLIGTQVFDPKGLWALLIVNVPNAEAATELMKGDPAYQAKIFTGEVAPCRTVFQPKAQP